MAEDWRSVRLRIEGRVQGVGFRAWTRGEAEALGLDGWVRNDADGSVEAFVSGRADAVERLIGIVRRGPPGSTVARVAVERAAGPAVENGFRIRR